MVNIASTLKCIHTGLVRISIKIALYVWAGILDNFVLSYLLISDAIFFTLRVIADDIKCIQIEFKSKCRCPMFITRHLWNIKCLFYISEWADFNNFHLIMLNVLRWVYNSFNHTMTILYQINQNKWWCIIVLLMVTFNRLRLLYTLSKRTIVLIEMLRPQLFLGGYVPRRFPTRRSGAELRPEK